MAKSDRSSFFRRTSLFWVITVTLAFGYFSLAVFAPEKLPLDSLGAFGSFTGHLVENHADILFKGWWAAIAVHVFEAVMALKVCRNKGISNGTTRCLWFLQTLLFGFASLGLLLKYDPERPKQR